MKARRVWKDRRIYWITSLRLKKNDVLRINVSSSSINEEIVAPFQMRTGSQQSQGGGGQNPSLSGYLVSPDGMINFPVLGEIKVEGFDTD